MSLHCIIILVITLCHYTVSLHLSLHCVITLYHYTCHYTVSLHCIITLCHYTGTLHRVVTLCHYTVSLQLDITMCHYTVPLQCAITLGHCNDMPGLGTEPMAPEFQADVLTTTLSRPNMIALKRLTLTLFITFSSKVN